MKLSDFRPGILARVFGRSAGQTRVDSSGIDSTQVNAASQLPPIPLPKAPTKQTTLPSFRTGAERAEGLIAKTTRATLTTDTVTYQTAGATPAQLIRNFLSANPDLAATVNAYIRVGIPEHYTVVARNLDGTLNPEGTRAVHEVLNRITFLADPTLGYNPTTDLQSISESLAREILLDGAMALELVLDKQRMPVYPTPVAVSTLSFKEDNQKGVYPVQVIGGDEYDLDIPTFFYLSIDQDLLTPYSVGYLAVAVRAVLNDEGFSNFLQRQLKRNISPRMVATIVEEKIIKGMDPRILNDPEKSAKYFADVIAEIDSTLQGLEPEDALVTTDAVTYDLKAPGGSGSGVGEMLESVYGILQSRITAALKSLPAVLGRDSSSGSATTSTMLFLKNANMVRTKLNTIYSRMLTMAVRLLGHDVFVQFSYDELDLRPKNEQRAYDAMHQSTILEQLSLGLISDEQACIALTRHLPPEGYQNKSGSMFQVAQRNINDTTSQTSNMNGQPDNLKSNAPSGAKSKKG